MTAARAHAAVQADRFHLVLSFASPAAELEAWIDGAEPGHEVIYASGLLLPRAEQGVVLVTAWKDAGVVETFQRRDPADPRRWQFLCRKTARPHAPGPGGFPPVAARATRHPDAAKVLTLLRALAPGEPCPSNADIARQIGLARGEAGRSRAQYLIDQLSAEGAIAVERRGRCEPRTVRVMEDRGDG